MTEVGSSIATPVVVKVTTAGTRVQLPTSGEKYTALGVVIQALSTNEEAVVVGDANVVAKAGTHASPEQRGIELAAKEKIAIDLCDTAGVWVDSRKNGDGVALMLVLA